MTRALITNDDGIDSAGLHALARLALDLGLDVVVAAPSRESSGASASLGAVEDHGHIVTESRTIEGLEPARVLAVQAAPALIVRAAVHGAFGPEPDLVLSGINQGANTGHAVLHSGTVGAAFTARAFGRPALAVSLDTGGDLWHWETATGMAEPLVRWLMRHDTPVVLNLNVPNVGADAVRGLRRAPLATFGAVQTKVSERGHGYVRLEYREVDVTAEPDSDAAMLAHRWASVTPLLAISEAGDVDLGDLTLR
ncbi:MAG: 5'/3'-nucleotidase SurE [Acidimicrobiales bacterium]|nr:5'/3'-nucleotidase SurE [Acidimicrobiales bacterium]